MSGHSHWAGIKHKKGVTDQKRGQLFSKLLKVISIAARNEPNPQFNPRLRAAIEKARENNVPRENIERAINKASEEKNLEELLIGAYGPAGVAVLIEAITDNKNRTIAEIKKTLSDNGAKFSEPEAVRWAFDLIDGGWRPKFKQETKEGDAEKIEQLISELEEHEDVQKVITNY